MRETRTSGSVRDGVGNVPIYSASGFDDLFLAVEGIIPPIVIGLEDALPVTQKVLRVDPLTVRGIIKDHDGMRGIRLTADTPRGRPCPSCRYRDGAPVRGFRRRAG